MHTLSFGLPVGWLALLAFSPLSLSLYLFVSRPLNLAVGQCLGS